MEFENIKDRFPCFLCTEMFVSREGFDSHLTKCVKDATILLHKFEKEYDTLRSSFCVNGEESIRLEAEQYQIKIKDIYARLDLFGFKRVANGHLSAFYSKFFSNYFCGYCNMGFIEQSGMIAHSNNCMKTAIHLKNLFHTGIKEAERSLAEMPYSLKLRNRIDEFKICHSQISYKLLLNDGIRIDSYIL